TSRWSGRASGPPTRSGSPGNMADAPPAAPLLLASTSPQRRAILEQLQIPFDVVAPRYEEQTSPDADPLQLVRQHARAKAQSVADIAEDRPVVGVDTAVVLDGRIFGKPGDAAQAERMLGELSGKTHVVVSGLCVLTPGWEAVEHEATQVAFRDLTPRELGTYVAACELVGRAGCFAIQGR